MQCNAICYAEKSHQLKRQRKYLHQKPNHRNQVVQFAKEEKQKRKSRTSENRFGNIAIVNISIWSKMKRNSNTIESKREGEREPDDRANMPITQYSF